MLDRMKFHPMMSQNIGIGLLQGKPDFECTDWDMRMLWKGPTCESFKQFCHTNLKSASRELNLTWHNNLFSYKDGGMVHSWCPVTCRSCNEQQLYRLDWLEAEGSISDGSHLHDTIPVDELLRACGVKDPAAFWDAPSPYAKRKAQQGLRHYVQ
jgi:hypothetical protein